MDVTYINPFIEAVMGVLPQLGFESIVRKSLSVKGNKINVSGVALTIGMVGEKKGNVVYVMNVEGAKKIASTMMMGMPVDEFDDMAKSAVSELSNMLSANASMNFSNQGIITDISIPALMYGESIEISMSTKEVLCVEFDVDGIEIQLNIALD